MSVVKACVTAFAFFAVAQATIVIGNVNVVGNGTSTITWSSTDAETDPESVTIELTNPSFHTQFAVGNNIPTPNGQFSFQTPQILPGDGYAMQLVNNSNANDIFAMSPTFSVAENDVVKNSTSSSSKPTSSGLSPVGTSGLPAPSSNPSVPSVTPSGASPTFATPGASNSSSSASSSASPSSTSNTVFNNNGASSLKMAPAALLLVGAAFAFF